MRYLVWLALLAPAVVAAITVRDVLAADVPEPWRDIATIAAATAAFMAVDYLINLAYDHRHAEPEED
ncbi:hypothetical protein [Streptomyces lasiicapitis]|uniref:hypothetical protein n=1 Tax=Streptomyces lasiicapitis TaxID=1923961 RepID=UPI0036A4F2EE